MLQIITAQVEFTQPGQGPPAGQEKQVIFAQSSVFEVHVDESLSYPVKYDRQTIAYVAVAQVQSTQQRQSLHTYIRCARLVSGYLGYAQCLKWKKEVSDAPTQAPILARGVGKGEGGHAGETCPPEMPMLEKNLGIGPRGF